MNLRPGDLVLNDYKIRAKLGSGGMATTYIARHKEIDRDVVIKTSPEDKTLERDDIERLRREAQLMANLKHDSLPMIHDANFDDQPIIVMEYIPGPTLKDRLSDGPIRVDEAVEWLIQLLDALVYMHEAPIIHCDVKPSNIIIRNDTEPPRAVLLDFGIARRLDSGTTTTLIHGFLSTGYAPIEMYEPEQLEFVSSTAARYVLDLRRERRASRPATDVYGLAAAFYHALTYDTPPPLAYQRLQRDRLEPLHELRADVPLYLSNVLMKALSVHPDDRYQTASEMKAALEKPIDPHQGPWVAISAGNYRLGSELEVEALNDEMRSHPVALDAFQIGRYLVTNQEYQLFIEADPTRPVPTSPNPLAAPFCWHKRRYPSGAEGLPVVLVSWQDAVDYCQWLAGETGLPCRLPTEAEWEIAAGWDPTTQASRLYPWGATFDKRLCAAGLDRPSVVGQFAPQGNSPSGLVDAVGNVWQWTSSGLWRYPYRRDGREDPATSERYRIVRGGAFDADEPERVTMCAWRAWRLREGRFHNVGFRVAVGVVEPTSLQPRTLPRDHTRRPRV